MSVVGIKLNGEELMIHLVNNFLTDEECNLFVSHLDESLNNNKLEARGQFKHRLMRYDDPKVNDITKKYAIRSKILSEVYQNPGYDLHVTDYGMFISHEGYSMPPHIDVINDGGVFDYLKYTAVVYLNDNYTGGSIYFPNLDQHYFPNKGDVILFPSDRLEYLHGVSNVESGDRYTLSFWFSDDGDWIKYFE